ncbi:MAG: DUF6586 family protein [Porticoccaceae bacterium]
MSAQLSRVNQKLYFARLLLADMAADGDPRRQQLAGESLLFQLRLAYHFHLRDIAASYQCRDVSGVNDAASLARALEAIDKSPAEAREIDTLASSPGSWLNRLLVAWEQAFAPPEMGSSAIQEGLIPVARVEMEMLDAATLGAWHRALTELVERHREVMVEC